MEKYKQKQFSNKNKKIYTDSIYSSVLALYTNLAIDIIELLIKPYKDKFRPRRTLSSLCENIDDVEKQDEITYYVNEFKEIYPFVNYILHPSDTDKDCLKKIYTWVNLLKNIRNQYSHSVCKNIHLDKNTRDEMLNLYGIAIENAYLKKDKDIPRPFKCKKLFVRIENDYALTLTGVVFCTTLFLRIQDISAFLGLLMQMDTLRNNRQKHKKYSDTITPNFRYPKMKNRIFLHQSVIYTYWTIRKRNVSSIDEKIKDQIRFFELMEYLRKCPLERVTMAYKDNIPQEQQTETCILKQYQSAIHPKVIIQEKEYILRRRNHFINYALDYWTHQIENQFSDGTEWKWAHCASREQKQDNKKKKNFEKLNFQERVVWEKSQKNTTYNVESEIELPYYVEDNNIFFRLKKEDHYIVGMMSVKVLYDLLRNYFSADDKIMYVTNLFEQTWKYLYQYLEYTHTYKEQNPCLAVPKKYLPEDVMSLVQNKEFADKINVFGTLSWSIEKEIDDAALEYKIRQRISYLKTYYEQMKQTSVNSLKVMETVRAWFAILNYGKKTNWEHAFGTDEIDNSLISQYKYITYYLSRLVSPEPNLSEEFDNYLFRTGLKKLLLHEQPYILHKCYHLNNYFNNAINYRLQILNYYGEILTFPFVRKDWKPTEALRWLKIRTPERAKEYPKRSPIPTEKIKLPVEHAVLNTEKGVYFAARAVPLPHNFYTKTLDAPKQETNTPVELESAFYNVNMKLFKAGHFRKLYAIKQQDMVLSHIALYYAQKAEINLPQPLTVSDNNYQSIELSIPFTVNSRNITVCYYYPYFKQSHYKLFPELFTELLEVAVQFDKIPADGKIYFNNLKPKKKEDGKIVFKQEDDTPTPTLWHLWKKYNASRIFFFNSLMWLEKKLYRKYNDFPSEITYIPFGYYVYQAKKDDLNSILNDINEMRTAALHGKVAFPFVKLENDEIDFFGEGNKLIDQILNEIRVKKRI
ncbi:MAG: hypothetical protein LBG80_02935 [Bacteroidales bacterium]|jgi:hypothetical protein|nr:hypothetical protein [Bacteroidales bacterium]